MPSASTSANARLEARGVLRLVGSAFGFFVWGAHFLVVYIAEAVACQLAVVSVLSPGAGLIALLATGTVLAALVVIAHAWRLSRRWHADGEDAFLARIGVGQDAIATLAILWQLIPLFTVPVCR
jgi:hypothetical protein